MLNNSLYIILISKIKEDLIMLDWYYECEVKVYPPRQKIVTDILLVGERDKLTPFEESLAEEAEVSVENLAVYEISNNKGMKMYIMFNGSKVVFGMGISDWIKL